MPPAKKAPEATKPAQANEPKDAIDLAVSLVPKTMEFLGRNFTPLFMKLFKLGVILTAVDIALWLAAAILTFGLLALFGVPFGSGLSAILGYISASTLLTGVLVVWLIALFIAITWVANSISTVAYFIVKGQFENTYPGIQATFDKIRFRVLGYTLLHFIIMAVFVGIPLLAFLAMLQTAPGVSIALFVAYLLAFILLYSFLTQFWLWELSLGEKQAPEALMASLALVRDNPAGVLVYSVVHFLAWMALFLLVAVVTVVIDAPLSLADKAANSSPALYVAILVIGMLVRMLLSVLDVALTESVLFPYGYQFWSAIRKK